MARQFADNAESTLASGIASGATSLTVAAGHGARFPTTGDFTIRLQDATDASIFELVTCTARSTDTLTITATTLAWDAADKVFHVVAKADLDSFLQAAVFRGVRLYLPSNLATHFPTGTVTSVPFAVGTEKFDTDAFHDTATNNTRITIPVGLGGYYSIRGQIVYGSNATGTRQARLNKNGSVFYVTTFSSIASTNSATFSVTENLAAGDYIELLGNQDSGSSLDALGHSTGLHTTIAVEYLGA